LIFQILFLLIGVSFECFKALTFGVKVGIGAFIDA
jgi:hypothetical protein